MGPALLRPFWICDACAFVFILSFNIHISISRRVSHRKCVKLVFCVFRNRIGIVSPVQKTGSRRDSNQAVPMTPSNSIAYILLSMAIITPTLGQDAFVVHDCDGLDGWTFLGNVQPSIQQDNRRENNRMLVLKYTGAGQSNLSVFLSRSVVPGIGRADRF